MAERRMLTRKVTEDDHFMSLSASAQALYLHLSMSADDDGFCNQVTIAMFRAHASVQDLEALLEKRYIYQFENGVIVIKHWRMANALRKDRYTPTTFKNELEQLNLDENGAYTMNGGAPSEAWLPDGCQMVANRLPQDSIGKDSIGKDSIGKDSIGKDSNGQRKRFTPPTIDEVKAYIAEKGYQVDANKWLAHYESNGWKVGKNSMKDWKASIRYWASQDNQNQVKTSIANDWLNA